MKWDKWHFIFAFLGQALFTAALYVFSVGGPWALLLSLTEAFLLVFFLQGMNEFLQLNSDESIFDHGGESRFIANSRKDWKLFWRGVLAGQFAGVALALSLRNLLLF